MSGRLNAEVTAGWRRSAARRPKAVSATRVRDGDSAATRCPARPGTGRPGADGNSCATMPATRPVNPGARAAIRTPTIAGSVNVR